MGLALLPALFFALTACQKPSEPSSGSAELDVMQERCVSQMVRQTCTVMNDATRIPPSGSVVLIAGIGRVDAQAYAQLRASGEAMCSQMRQKCLADWDGNACRTARQVWGQPR